LEGLKVLKYRIISVGRIREKFYSEGIKEYLKRLGAYTNIELITGLEEKVSPRAGQKDIEKLLLREGERILALVGEDDLVVILDTHGLLLASDELAEYLGKWTMSGKSKVNLVIGSSHGLADTVKKRANYSLALSRLTFPHQMAVLVLSEQIYRGFKILKDEPYHK
jgi:23S rRNA (pseudouridine1915-N3)-methyltransferase